MEKSASTINTFAKIGSLARASVVVMAETNEVAEQICVRAVPNPRLVENVGRLYPIAVAQVGSILDRALSSSSLP